MSIVFNDEDEYRNMSKEKVSHGRNAARFKQAASIFFIIQYQQLL
jgi:hypothetical protein